MKKNIFIFCITLLSSSLTAYGIISWSNQEKNKIVSSCGMQNSAEAVDSRYGKEDTVEDLVYDVDSRFMHTITMEELNKAKTIFDIYPKKAAITVDSYESVLVSTVNSESEIKEFGFNEILNKGQLELIKSFDYSTNFYVQADYLIKNEKTGEMSREYIVYYITIVPEQEAVYIDGKNALISYLKNGTSDKTSIIKRDKLKSGQVSFTVSKEGKIKNVELWSTSGYPTVDEELLKTVTNIPGKWVPATNSKGEKVDQEFVFFFGLQGC